MTTTRATRARPSASDGEEVLELQRAVKRMHTGRAREDEDEDAREGADRRRDDFARDFLARSGCVGEARRRAATPPATLRLEYWTRDETTTEAKRAHIDRLDDELGYYGVEEHIERTVLKGKPVAIETNMFPYETPRGVTHMTCLLYTSPSPRDLSTSRMPSSA